jgi:hypothetical protein
MLPNFAKLVQSNVELCLDFTCQGLYHDKKSCKHCIRPTFKSYRYAGDNGDRCPAGPPLELGGDKVCELRRSFAVLDLPRVPPLPSSSVFLAFSRVSLISIGK